MGEMSRGSSMLDTEEGQGIQLSQAWQERQGDGEGVKRVRGGILKGLSSFFRADINDAADAMFEGLVFHMCK